MNEIPSNLPPGAFVGHYQIVEVAGAGGMGVVYKAFDQKLERTVALKFLPASKIASADAKIRFLKEARAASSLDHLNIGVIHGIEEPSHGHSYIVMAFYGGKSLADEIREGPLPLRRGIDVAYQMLCGLQYAHNHKIVHRDIKPSNVMVTPEGVVKIVDFGLAGLIRSEAETVSGQIAGTIGYMSPEQTLGRPVDQRTDIWAWATVLLEILTGRNPYRRHSVSSTISAILSEPPQGVEEIPVSLHSIVYRALAKRPINRYQSCGEILQGFEAAKKQINFSTANQARTTQSIGPKSLRKYKAAATNSRLIAWSTKRIFVVGALLAVLLGSLLVLTTPLRESFHSGIRPERLAVLPFDNNWSDPTNNPIAAGLMETMSGKLSNLDTSSHSLWVIPSSEVRRQNITDPTTALRDLGASLAVKGSIERNGNNLHLTANLIDTKHLRQVGSVVVENHSGDLAALQDEAVLQLSRLLNVSVRENTLISSPSSGTPATYEGYLKAVGFMQRYDHPGNLDNAIRVLEQATQVDPSFALAYAQLGEAYRLKYQLDQNSNWLTSALSNCQKAVEIDHRVTTTYVTLGRIHEMSGQHDLAVQEFQRVLDSNPRDAGALTGIARSYENAGHIKQAEAAYRRAVALRPDYWDFYDELALFYDRQNNYSEALKQLQQAVSLTPDNAQVYSNIGAVSSDTDDPKFFADAERALKRSLDLAPSYAAYANLGNLYYKEKRYADSAAMTEKALQLNSNDYLVWGNLIVAYERLRESEKLAFANKQLQEHLEHAVEVKPQDAMAQSLLAMVYADQKRRQISLVRIQTALALAPDNPEILENVAIAYEKRGERSQSLMYLSQAIKKGLSLDDATNEPRLQFVVNDPEFQRRVLAAGPIMK
jgi:serine/threonine protein kinase/tetratricopeptide (TPR) repeat protein